MGSVARCAVGILVYFCVVAYLAVIILCALVFWLVQKCMNNLSIKFAGEQALTVSPDDCIWLQDSPQNRSICHAVLEFKGKPDLDTFQCLIWERLVSPSDPDNPLLARYPKVVSYPSLVLQRYVWVEDKTFDIVNHVFLSKKLAPQDRVEFQSFVSDIATTPLPEKKSPWQFIIVPSHKPDSETFYGIFRVHHAVADGVSLLRMTTELLADPPSPESSPSIPLKKPTPLPKWKMYAASARAILEGPGIVLEESLALSDNTILHGPKCCGIKLMAWSEPMDINMIKDIRRKTHTTFTDVIMSCIAGSLADHIRKYGSHVPSTLLAYVPVNFRPIDSKLTLDNQFALVSLRLPLQYRDPIDLLHATRDNMNEIKSSPEVVVNSLTARYMAMCLPNMLSKRILNWFTNKGTLGLTSIPGPATSISMNNNVLQSMIAWPPSRSNVGKYFLL